MARSKVSTKGQITIPNAVRKKLNLKTGDVVDFMMDEDEVKLVPLKKTVAEVFAVLSRPRKKPLSTDEIAKRLKKTFKEKG